MKNLEGLYQAFSNFESTDYEVVFESFPTNVITRFLTGKRTYLTLLTQSFCLPTPVSQELFIRVYLES
jgi:hypothetical protein